MPGARGGAGAQSWFESAFGFTEGRYDETRSRFEFKDDVLTSKVNKVTFHVGPFELVSCHELRSRLHGSKAVARHDGLKFANILGDVRALHRDRSNEGAVFQVASQFNCLEMLEPGVTPLHGITDYAKDATQGPACAMSCPAGTLFRNYFVNGVGQGHHQLDGLSDAAKALDNDRNKYWKMSNGYCLPASQGSLASLKQRLQTEMRKDGSRLIDYVSSLVKVGVHWDTEVVGGSHRVCQVFASALPVAYAKSTPAGDWEPFARAVLNAAFEATLLAAALLAQHRQERVTVYLTAIGGGAFGNRTNWITDAMQAAMLQEDILAAPLDVKLVHFGTTMPRGIYQEMEQSIQRKAKGTRPSDHHARGASKSMLPAIGAASLQPVPPAPFATVPQGQPAASALCASVPKGPPPAAAVPKGHAPAQAPFATDPPGAGLKSVAPDRTHHHRRDRR